MPACRLCNVAGFGLKLAVGRIAPPPPPLRPPPCCRCEPAHVLDRCAAGGVSAFHVEKVAPQHAPEGSLWRKTRTVSTSNPAAPWPPAWFEAQSASAEQQPEVAAAASAGGDVPDAVAVPAAEEEVQQQEDVAPVKEAGQQLYEVKVRACVRACVCVPVGEGGGGR